MSCQLDYCIREFSSMPKTQAMYFFFSRETSALCVGAGPPSHPIAVNLRPPPSPWPNRRAAGWGACHHRMHDDYHRGGVAEQVRRRMQAVCVCVCVCDACAAASTTTTTAAAAAGRGARLAGRERSPQRGDSQVEGSRGSPGSIGAGHSRTLPCIDVFLISSTRDTGGHIVIQSEQCHYLQQ